jgi:Heparinase II/III-like protein/Heparinase II/III N-terminus
MTSFLWKLNRLRAMNGQEVLHRGYRWLWQRAEKWLLAFGWQPHPIRSVSHKKCLFQPKDEWEFVWSKHFSLDNDKLHELINGKIDLLFYQSLGIGQPVNWHRDPLTGKQTPLVFGKTLDYRNAMQVGDIKVLWELGRHQHLIPLAAAYACSGNSHYRDAVVAQIEGWIETNPFGMGVHWCSALEVGLRLISWSVVHSLFMLRNHELGLFSVVNKPGKLGLSIYQHAWFIRHFLSRHSSANNHLIGELVGLWVGSQVFDLGGNSEEWGAFAQQELEEQAVAQNYSDGVNKEQAIYYHLWVLEYLLFAWLVGERSQQPFSEIFRKRMLRMSEFLGDISLENGGPPQIGDSDNGFVTRFEPSWPIHPYQDVQSAIAHIFKDHHSISKTNLSTKGFWYGLMAGLPPAENYRIEGPGTRQYPLMYEEGGYAMLGDKNLHLVFDAGSLGYPSIAAHGHADALSFCLGLDGEWWMVDPGTYAYHREAEWRDYFRGTSAHNTMMINGLNQSRIGGAFLWLEQAHACFESSGKEKDGEQYVRGMHDGYKAIGVLHHREIRYQSAKGIVEIKDILENKKPNRPFHASIYFHFTPDMKLDLGKSSVLATKPGTHRKLKIYLDMEYQWTVVKGQTGPILGWYSPNIGEKAPAPVLIGNRQGLLPKCLTTKIEVL